MTSRITSFTAERVNSTTFVVIEDDSWNERPRIYALLHPELRVLVLSDTGCNSPRDKCVKIPHLRNFLEQVPIPSNNNKPLNPGPERRAYVILCSHCHYDHIGGIEQFSLPRSSPSPSSSSSSSSSPSCFPDTSTPQQTTDTTSGKNTKEEGTTIIASAHGRGFIEDDLPTHSLCASLGIRTPEYKVTHWAEDFERLHYPINTLTLDTDTTPTPTLSSQIQSPQDLGITILQTPGHTPDSLSWYDRHARHVYIGDSAYERGEEGMPIIFPREGDWSVFMMSMRKVLDFVITEEEGAIASTIDDDDDENYVMIPAPVKLSAAHTTTSIPAEEFLHSVLSFFEDIIAGRIKVEREWMERGERYCLWSEQNKRGKEARFAVQAPRRLRENIKKERRLS